MHVYILFAHPSHDSFTYEVMNAFCRGLRDAGHETEIGDLYRNSFKTDMSPEEYLRETSLDASAPVSDDVKAEQDRISAADALAFIYPVWWSDCPARLKGWFDRVWSNGYAYQYDADKGHSVSSIHIEKALVLCPAGHPEEHLEETGIAESMRRIMVEDRLLGVGIKKAEMVILGGMVLKDNAIRSKNVQRAYQLGQSF
jgi:NAD(P)H dehydrogenase (quinone)